MFKSESSNDLEDKTSRPITELFAPLWGDDLRRVEGGAVYTTSALSGGREAIGTPYQSLNSLGTKVGMVAFGWLYILGVLSSLRQTWIFIPKNNAEFVSIRVKESVAARRVMPAVANHLCTAAVIVAAEVVILATLRSADVTGDIYQYVSVLGSVALAFAPSFAAMRALTSRGEGLAESHLEVSYGFPRKVTLLSLRCNGSARELAEKVEQTATALNDFGSWTQVNVQGAKDVSVSVA